MSSRSENPELLFRNGADSPPLPVPFLPGESLASALRRAGIGIALHCGGRGRCGSCRVRLLAGRWQLPEGERTLSAPGIIAPACRSIPLAGAVPPEAEMLSGVPGEAIFAEARFAPSWKKEECPPGVSAAIDLGTTTLAGVMIADGEAVASAGCANAQARFGDNVIDRIAAASTGAGEELRRALLAESLAPLLDELAAAAGCRPKRIVLAGNTAMSCFAAGIPTEPLGRAPFAAPATVFPTFRAAELGLGGCAPGATVELVPGLESFLGGDTTAGLYAAGLAGEAPPEAPVLFIDLGTNCETVLMTPTGSLAASAAAGPAFERRGSVAGPGAVLHLDLAQNGNFLTETAAGAPPHGLCGAAWLDLLVLLRRLGVIGPDGLFVPGERERRRCAAERGGSAGCRIAPGIVVTEADLAELLAAKAAVAAGVETLLAEVGTAPGTLAQVVLAGGFAAGSRPESLRGVGMLPLPASVPVATIGNASLAGCAKLAAAGIPASSLSTLRRRIRVRNLAGIPGFSRRYIDALALP